MSESKSLQKEKNIYTLCHFGEIFNIFENVFQLFYSWIEL